jgi:hypothetical protein
MNSKASSTASVANKSGEPEAGETTLKKEKKKKKSDRVLRLPSYFNRCGAAALVRERVLNRLLTKVYKESVLYCSANKL